MTDKLPTELLNRLRPLEIRLKNAVASGNADLAIELAGQIQALFEGRRRHHRLLRAKLWAFEAALDARRSTYAETGFRGIRKLSNPRTRLRLEASSLLAVSLLRQKRVDEAKRIIRKVIADLNDIQSDRKRHQFQKRLVARIEEECILVELVGTGSAELDAGEIHEKAVLLLQRNSETEILKLIGNAIPSKGLLLLRDVRDYSIKQLPAPDRKLLPAPDQAERPLPLGKRVKALVGRIGWRTLCAPDSTIYGLWSKRIPKVFNQGYFAAAVAATLKDWKIGLPLLGSGITALVMKYSAHEFCSATRPKGLMIEPSDSVASEESVDA